jgi:hypothetical protein
MNVHRDESLRWMQRIRQSIYGKLRIEDRVDPEIAAANPAQIREVLGPRVEERLPRSLDDKIFDKLLTDVAAVVVGCSNLTK